MNLDERLLQDASDFIIALRMGDGCNEELLRQLHETLLEFCSLHKDSEVISKDAARTLIDLIPMIDSAAEMYSGQERERVRNASALLFDTLLESF